MNILDQLRKFQSFQERAAGPVDFSVLYQPERASEKKLCISCLIHGDEVGVLPSVLRILADLFDSKSLAFEGQILFFIGNPEAAKKGKRYLERDLNRSFRSDELSSLEARRAQELEACILSSDLYIDLHQTIEDSEDYFYIMANHEGSRQWAGLLSDIKNFVTHDPSELFSRQGLCSDELAQSQNIPALSIEFLKKGYSQQVEDFCYRYLRYAITKADQLLGDQKAFESKAQFSFVLNTFEIFHREKLSHSGEKLVDGLSNLQKVKTGQVLGTRNGDPKIIAPQDSVLMFPKYHHREDPAATLPDSLFLLAKKI